MFNLGKEDYNVELGTAFCQLVLHTVTLGIVVNNLPAEEKREEKGFGSSETSAPNRLYHIV